VSGCLQYLFPGLAHSTSSPVQVVGNMPIAFGAVHLHAMFSEAGTEILQLVPNQSHLHVFSEISESWEVTSDTIRSRGIKAMMMILETIVLLSSCSR